MVLVGGSPKFIATDDFPYGIPQNGLDTFGALFKESYSKGMRAFMEYLFPEPGTNYLKEWGLEMSQKTTLEIALNSLTNLFVADLRPLLGKINVPTLILHGENDAVLRWENAKYTHENIPGSKMYIFKGKGHFPSVTAADEFNKILKEFITRGLFSQH